MATGFSGALLKFTPVGARHGVPLPAHGNGIFRRSPQIHTPVAPGRGTPWRAPTRAWQRDFQALSSNSHPPVGARHGVPLPAHGNGIFRRSPQIHTPVGARHGVPLPAHGKGIFVGSGGPRSHDKVPQEARLRQGRNWGGAQATTFCHFPQPRPLPIYPRLIRRERPITRFPPCARSSRDVCSPL